MEIALFSKLVYFMCACCSIKISQWCAVFLQFDMYKHKETFSKILICTFNKSPWWTIFPNYSIKYSVFITLCWFMFKTNILAGSKFSYLLVFSLKFSLLIYVENKMFLLNWVQKKKKLTRKQEMFLKTLRQTAFNHLIY